MAEAVYKFVTSFFTQAISTSQPKLGLIVFFFYCVLYIVRCVLSCMQKLNVQAVPNIPAVVC